MPKTAAELNQDIVDAGFSADKCQHAALEKAFAVSSWRHRFMDESTTRADAAAMLIEIGFDSHFSYGTNVSASGIRLTVLRVLMCRRAEVSAASGALNDTSCVSLRVVHSQSAAIAAAGAQERIVNVMGENCVQIVSDRGTGLHRNCQPRKITEPLCLVVMKEAELLANEGHKLVVIVAYKPAFKKFQQCFSVNASAQLKSQLVSFSTSASMKYEPHPSSISSAMLRNDFDEASKVLELIVQVEAESVNSLLQLQAYDTMDAKRLLLGSLNITGVNPSGSTNAQQSPDRIF